IQRGLNHVASPGTVAAILSLDIGASFVFFFFSSRRRHTRWPRDWSSDVCSSDLVQTFRAWREAGSRARTFERSLRQDPVKPPRRSEERRVGKECRSRWWTEH